MVKRTVSISDEADKWYHGQLISLSKFVQSALDKAIEDDKTFKEQLKKEYPTLVQMG